MSGLEELKRKRELIDKKSSNTLSNMDMIIQENYRVADIAHNATSILDELDKEFERKTGLNSVDTSFLFFATALQCIRQYVFTSFEERVNDKESAKESHKKENKIYDKYFDENDSIGNRKRYYNSLEDIMTKGVPYDAQDGSKKFDLGGRPNVGLNGNSHRFRTLGHDPILGWVFGTANIMTSTLTDWKFSSYHIKDLPLSNGVLRAGLYQHASTEKMLEKTYTRIKTEPIAFAAAIVKQALHYESDVYSTAGLPIPVVSSLISPEFSQKLANYGLDIGNVLTVGKQASGAIFINTLIAMIHRLFYDENTCESEKLYEVKTRKILSYSNAISSASNILYVAVSAYNGNGGAVKKLDIGGILVTIDRLISDYNFIRKVKEEFVFGSFDKLIQGEEYNFN